MLTTLGVGNIIPDLPALRLEVTAEAFTGFAVLTAAVGYLLAIAQAGRAMATLALDIAVHFDNSDTPETLTVRLREHDHVAAWG